MTGAEVLAVASVVQGVSGFISGNANAKVAKQNADQAILLAAENEKRQRIANLQKSGKAAAAAGSQGGSSIDYADLFESNAIYDELDALTIRHRGAVEANNFRNEAKAAKSGAVGSLVGGFVGAGTSLYGTTGIGGGQSASSWFGNNVIGNPGWINPDTGVMAPGSSAGIRGAFGI